MSPRKTPPPGPQTAAERRAAEAELRTLAERFTPDDARLVAALRRRLRKRLPAAHEMVYEYRDCFVISWSPSGRGYEGVLVIRGSADGVRLYFNFSKGLPDPGKLLKGAGTRARWIPVEGVSALNRPAIIRLIEAAIARSPAPFARGGRGAVVVRATTASRSRRPRPA